MESRAIQPRTVWRAWIALPLVLLIVCSSTGIAHAADDADKPKRGDEFLLFRETKVELPGGDSRTFDRGTRGRVIQVEGVKVTAMLRGAKVEVPLDNIVSGRAGIARVTDAIRRNPADWAFRLIRADLYCNAGDFRAAIADVDAVPRDSDIFRHALFARAMIQYQVRNWQEMVNSLIECRDACEKANDKNMMTSVSAWTGMAKCKLGQHAEALADFDTAIAGGMDDAQTNSWRANALQELGRIDEVIKSLRRAVELDPYDEKIRVRLILAVKNVSGIAAALAEADRFIEESPRAANPFVVRATLQLLVGDASAALADAEQAIRTEPQHVEAHFAKAKVLLVQNKHDELREFCDALKELELVKAEHFSYRSYYFYGCDMPDDALADANKAVDGGIRDANLFLTRARIYGAREDWQEVISNATRAIELDRRDSEAYAWRFTARFQTNELELALADINQAISLSDNESSYFSYRALLFHRLDKRRETLADLRTAVALDPTDIKAWSSFTQALYADGHWDECIIALNELAEIQGKDSRFYFARACAWQKKGVPRMAVADLTEALQFKPGDAQLLIMRASSNYDAGEIEQSIADLDTAERAAPLSTNGRYVRGKIHERFGEYRQAIDEFQRILDQDEKQAFGHAGLARVFAMAADETVRDGKRALDHAAEACLLSHYSEALPISYLAAAFAETGDFKAAAEWQAKAIELAEELYRQELSDQLELYKAKKPYRKTPIARVAAMPK